MTRDNPRRRCRGETEIGRESGRRKRKRRRNNTDRCSRCQNVRGIVERERVCVSFDASH